MIHPDSIPGWLIALVMLHLAYMGHVGTHVKLNFDPIYFILFIPQALMFLLFSIMDLPLEIRGFWVRVSAILVPACLDAILIIQYLRRRKEIE